MRVGMGVLVLVTASACGGEPTEFPASAVRDSAGVRIVEYESAPSGASSLTLDPNPVFVHGSGPADYLFQTPWSGALQPDGGAVVADAGSQEVVTLAPDGRLRSVLARRGQGPTEVGRVMSVTVIGQDTVLIEDDDNSKLATFVDGDLVSTVSTAGDFSLTAALRVHGLDPSGRLMMGTSAFMPGFEVPWLPGHMVLLDPNGPSADTVGSFDMAPRIDMGAAIHPFMPAGQVTVSSGAWVQGRSDTPELRWHGAGGDLVQVVRWNPVVSYPTDEDMAERASRLRIDLRRVNGGLSGDALEQMVQRSLSRYEVDESRPHPLWADLQGDKAGRVWMADFTPSGAMAGVRRYIVLGPDGSWLGHLEFPTRFRFLDATDDLVLGVQRDELDVEHVVTYRLLGSGG